jgi:hypothetical protein
MHIYILETSVFLVVKYVTSIINLLIMLLVLTIYVFL